VAQKDGVDMVRCEQPLVERRLDREFVDGPLDGRLRIRRLDVAKQRSRGS
jgi:hypothetical protein